MSDKELVVAGEIVDERTGEIIPKGAPNTLPQAGNVLQLQINANVIGTLVLSPETEKVLDEKLDEALVRIRPDGLVYLPWTYYAEKLNKAFGRLQWGLCPQGSPQVKDIGNNNVLVTWGNWLVIKGIPVGFAVGETSYRTNNSTMSYGDAIEGAKSISLARNCKVLGVALELWDSEWVANWKKQYAEQYENNNKTLWRKKSKKVKKIIDEAKAEADNVGNENQDGRNASELDVDRDFPKDGAVAEAQSLSEHGEKPMTKKQILGDFHLIKEIAKATEKKDSEVAKYVGGLGDGKFTVSQIISGLKPVETVEQTGE